MSNVRPKVNIKRDCQILDTFEKIIEEVKDNIRMGKDIIAIESYPISNEDLIREKIINSIDAELVIDAKSYFIEPKVIEGLIKRNLTDDRIFGLMSDYKLEEFVDYLKLNRIKREIKKNKKMGKVTIVFGLGASFIEHYDLLLYADLTRWEVQMRYRSGEYPNWMAENAGEDTLRMIKRGYFFEWPLADRHKKKIFSEIDYILDILDEKNPKMLKFKDYYAALQEVAHQPFSLVPFFDPGVWGGHWMQETFGIGEKEKNLAWSFNGVPEENSLLLGFDSTEFETPANNLVFLFGEKLLGQRVFGRFGHEFPIRFNFLDTMGGQNLSLQVHPKIDYVQEEFGAHYTQDESYYVLESQEDAVVYLGVNNGIKKQELIDELKKAERGEKDFNDEKYIYRHKMQKHDHFLIPSGTIHSSGKNSVVLEISATPNRFTFKLWDWGRVDFDGLPRPVNIDHGDPNIDIYKDETWVKRELINQFIEVGHGDGWVEEKTGLHETEFIETRRHTFNKKVYHQNHGSVNMLNLVEGQEILVRSPDDTFPPFKVTYAQTFIIPATIKSYIIEPTDMSKGETLKTIKAFVK